MTAVNISPSPILQFFDNRGLPCVGGSVLTQVGGINAATYQDSAGSIPLPNPIPLNSRGEVSNSSGVSCQLFLTNGSTYTLTLFDAAGNQLNQATAVANIDGASALTASLASSASASVGAGMIGYASSNSYASGTAGYAIKTGFSDLASQASSSVGAAMVGFSASNAYGAGTAGYEMRSTYALRTSRTAPHANFNYFTSLFTVTQAAGPGRAVVQQDIADVFNSQFSGTLPAGTVYAGPNGNDSTGDGSRANPFLTLNKALRTNTAGTVYLLPNTIATAYDMGGGWRSSDTSGTLPKKLIAAAQPVYIAPPAAVTLSSVTWTATGGHANIWQTTTGTTNQPIRILQTDRLDPYGDPTPLRLVDAFGTTLATALTDLDTLGEGWFFDTSTGILYVRRQLESVNATTKTYLQGVWGATGSGVENHFYMSNSILYVEGVTMFGYFDIANVSGTTPQLWTKNVTCKYAAGNSRNVNGGYSYSQGDVSRRSTADHANYNAAAGVTARGIEINYSTSYAGDIDTFGSAATQPANPISTSTNKNGSSNHDSYVVRINGTHDFAYGPPVADTATSYTWCVGTQAGFSYAAVSGGQRYGFLMQGNSAWLDGCAARGVDAAINSDASAAVYTFNCAGTTVTSSSGTITAYIPS